MPYFSGHTNDCVVEDGTFSVVDHPEKLIANKLVQGNGYE